MIDYDYWSASMPCDEDLLPALGRVVWASLRLHHAVRDALNDVEGAPSDAPFDLPLGHAVARLRDAAARVAEPARTDLLEWCDGPGARAASSRDGVLGSITFTAPDGRQALGSRLPGRPTRYGPADLLRVVGDLVYADTQLPRGPYPRADHPLGPYPPR
ncbi:hypothetical protein GCM10022243_57480 [Saccharothrix violaceirubra]|uniref:Uncharacterized protein n=1 Tax=Saccharothrix violaceirubra TaxID=413306 RepID=A0A7W7T5U9_9PSEU|nr:hypothetical protein [Saccharothrix violaceirubra]MBB4965820.1 hypothetical protein [Saccharothrix violaceirubra]